MKLNLQIWLGLCCLLVACAGETPAPKNVSPTNPPIKVEPGESSILVPPTLDPAKKTANAEQSKVWLTMANRSDWNVCYVYISAPSEDSWGKDWLDSEEVISIDQTRAFKIDPGIYDIRAENCDYLRLTEQYEIDLTRSTHWEVNNPAILDIYSFQEMGDWKASGSGAQGEIAENAYALKASQPGSLGFATAGKKFDNLVLTVEATPTESDASAPAAYGLMCRLQPNGDGYLFLIREDGMYAVFRHENNERIPIVDWKTSENVLTGAKLNVIEAHCDGEFLGLRINGITEEKLTDTVFGDGDIGLAVLPGQSVNAWVQFDNLVVTEP